MEAEGESAAARRTAGGQLTRWGKGKAVQTSGAEMIAAAADVQSYLYGEAHVAASMPRAAAPPRLSPEQWRNSCVRRDVKCNSCALCKWEAEANRWHDWSPWREGMAMKLTPSTTRPAFVNLDAAILAWFEWELHGRTAPSGTGPLLDLIREGAQFSGARTPKRDNSLLRRSDDIVHIEQAMVRAFELAEMDTETCRAVLVARTHGVLEKTPTLDEVAKEAKLPPTFVRSLVKAARRSMHVELSARGLIPMPARASGLHWDIDVRRRALTKEPPP